MLFNSAKSVCDFIVCCFFLFFFCRVFLSHVKDSDPTTRGGWTNSPWHLQHHCWRRWCRHSSSWCGNCDRECWSSTWLGRHCHCMCTLDGCNLCTEPQLSSRTESLLWSASEDLSSTGCFKTLNKGTGAQKQTVWMSQPLICILNVMRNRHNSILDQNWIKWKVVLW